MLEHASKIGDFAGDIFSGEGGSTPTFFQHFRIVSKVSDFINHNYLAIPFRNSVDTTWVLQRNLINYKRKGQN